MSDQIIKKRFSPRCAHNKFIIDDSLTTVECGICGYQLNPIWVIDQLRFQESRYSMAMEEIKKTLEKAKAKTRCKCEHCKKMTRIVR